MEKVLTLDFLKDYIPKKNDPVFKTRPECVYIPRPPARRKYETAINPPDKNFFDLMTKRGVYLWIVAKEKVEPEMDKKIMEAYQSVKSLEGYKNIQICRTWKECEYWIKLCPCQIVVFEDIFDEVFHELKSEENASGFHIISSDQKGIEIAKLARENRKIRNIYDDSTYILSIVKQNMERLTITEEEKQIEQKMNAGEEFKKLLIRNIVFPNFIKLSKHDKSEHNQYRLHLIGLRKLTDDDLFASKEKFVEFSKEKFPNDIELIKQYANESSNSKEILRFYTLDSFFYRILNNTLRIAKNTEEFFSIGEPFNKVFDAIKKEYDEGEKIESMAVYRGADLTTSECEYLEDNMGKYIEINGFVSTSKSFETAKKFARERKNNTIFKITLKKVSEKFKTYDYGYVDLKECSAFDEDEVLINALNTFKIAGKEKLENFVVYHLEYGAIFEILDKDPDTLSENDRFAYYSFKELKEMNEEVKDIGEVYLRTYEPEKAVHIYEFKLEKMKNSTEPVKKEEIDELMVKAADAHLANGEPDKALKYYESIIMGKKKKKVETQKYDKHHTHQEQIRNEEKQKTLLTETQSTAETELIEISTKVTSIQNNNDKFSQAEEFYLETKKEIEKEIKKEWNVEIILSKVDLEWEIVEAKKTQMLFEEQYNLLKEIEKTLIEAIQKIKKDNLHMPFEEKKLRMKLTEVYEVMAQTTEQSETAKSRISEISSSFFSIYDELNPLVEKDSYEQGLINIRRSEILRRTDNYDEEKELKNYQSSINLIRKNTNETDEILPKVYSNLADFQKKITKKKLSKKVEISEAISTYKKQLKIETIIYSDSDPKPLNTKMQIAICERDDKNTELALSEFSEAYHTDLFKKKTKYTTHAKILFNMSQAYADKGEDGLAMKSLKEAYEILEKRLSKKDFEKSVLRFKIKLRIGRIYLSSSLRTPENLIEAEANLLEYHRFITSFYKYKHSDVAFSHNSLGGLYSVLKKFQSSKENFKLSIEIYNETVGENSMEVAKITSNLAVCYAQLRQIEKATKALLKSREIFEKIYSDLRKNNPFEYESLYIQSEIQTFAGEYQNAIESCEKSKEAERIFKELKSKKHSNDFFNSEIVRINNDSFNSRADSFRQDHKNSVFFNNSVINRPNFSMINPITEHSLKCDFRICECYLFMKNLEEAKKKLEKLKVELTDRIKDEKKNLLFKDTIYSKKIFYLHKCEEYLQKVNKALERRERQKRQAIQEQQQSPNQTFETVVKNDEIVEYLE